MNQVCISSGEAIAGVVGSVIVGASTLANFIPSPEKIDNGILRFISRVIHFVAFDIVTAVKK